MKISAYAAGLIFLLISFPILSSEASATWTIETVDSGGDVGGYTSIAIGSSIAFPDKVHIVYYDFTNKELKHATKACYYFWPECLNLQRVC